MQVQAALILGKTGDARALSALVSSLGDTSVAVRAASAAGLSILGDPAALPALRRLQADPSQAVRRRVLASIQTLETRQRSQIQDRRRAKILVKLEGFEGQGSFDPHTLGEAAQASRRLIDKMQDVALLNASEDPQTAAERHQRPVVVLRANLRARSAGKRGADLTVSADVEFLVERYPEQSIIGRLSGNASAKSQVDSNQEQQELFAAAIDAAVNSALQRGEGALVAAAGHG